MALSILLTVALVTIAQVQPPVPSAPARPDASLLRRIEAGDVNAIIQAGTSRNRAYIPALTRLVRGKGAPGYPEGGTPSVRLALAQLGAPEQLQQYWCAAISELPKYGVYPPIEEFASIGGWYAIEALSYFLRPNGDVHWQRAVRKYKEATDLMYSPPQILALQTLTRVVSRPPIVQSRAGASFAVIEQESAVWRRWIAEREPELRRLEPTGEGVEISAEACRDGQPRTRRR